MKKVWLFIYVFNNYKEGTRDVDHAVFKTEESARRCFVEEEMRYFEHYGKYPIDEYSYYDEQEWLLELEVPDDHRVFMLIEETPIL